MTRTTVAALFILGLALLLAFGAWVQDTYDHPRAPTVLPADHVMPPP